MADGHAVAGEKNQSTAVVPIRIPTHDGEDPEDPRMSDVDEWGRSERTRAVVRALYEPVYSKWFRAEWQGLEHIPRHGGALLVANHAGAIPSDAPVIMHGLEKELERPVYGLAEYFFRTLPVVGTLWARAGGVPAQPLNAYRLLKEQGQLALVFPEGTKGPSKSYTDRYQLRRFGRGGFVEIAMRAGVPIVPIAVVGSEETMPVVFRLPNVARLSACRTCRSRRTCSPWAQSAPSCPSPPSSSCTSSTRCSSTSLPIRSATPRVASWTNPSTFARNSKRPSTTCCATGAASGSVDGPARPCTGADTFWGGRMIQALESDPSMDVILGTGAQAPSVPFERAEFVRTDQNYSILSRIVNATKVDTILHTFMITNSVTVPRRAMHEINVIGTMNLLAAAGAAGSSVRHVIVKSSTLVYGSSATDPNTFHEDTRGRVR